MDEQDELHAAGKGEAVEEKLRKPLLVDPAHSLSPDGKCIVMWQPVLNDLAAADECQPTVLDELLRQRDYDNGCVERAEED